MRIAEDFYNILGVNFQASTNDIKKAYRRLMLKYHPDVTNERISIEKFENVVKAYKVLSDSSKREEYNKIYHINFFSTQTQVKQSQTMKPQESSPEDKKSSFFDRFNFRFLHRLKDKKDDEIDDTFFKVPKELLNINPITLKEQFTQSTNKYVRSEALKSLVIQCGRKSFRFIEKGLEDHSKEVKEVSIRAIGKLKIRQGLLNLSILFNNSGPQLKRIIVQTIGNLEFSKANDLLIQYCYDDDEEVRLEAVKAVKRFKLYSYIPKIKGLVYDRNPEIKHLVKSMLKEHANS
ncbi:MAG: DnaJ domain-containing protein [Spirochaetota bacterium]|nr:DnaJ domain-containing protein [Spirochaetota bacterium]